MRVVVAAPRKSGGAHLRCLLSMAYDLKAPPVSAPDVADHESVTAWLAELPVSSVSTCDLPYYSLSTPATGAEVQLVGIIRHPFDLFLSNFDVAQQRAARGREDEEGTRPWNILAGESLESGVTQRYAEIEFGNEVCALRDWSASGRAIRYEDLLADPASTLRSLGALLGPLPDDQVVHAIALCPPENVVVSRPGRGRRMPTLLPGEWKHRLPPALVATLRAKYGDDTGTLRYDLS